MDMRNKYGKRKVGWGEDGLGKGPERTIPGSKIWQQPQPTKDAKYTIVPKTVSARYFMQVTFSSTTLINLFQALQADMSEQVLDNTTIGQYSNG